MENDESLYKRREVHKVTHYILRSHSGELINYELPAKVIKAINDDVDNLRH